MLCGALVILFVIWFVWYNAKAYQDARRQYPKLRFWDWVILGWM